MASGRQTYAPGGIRPTARCQKSWLDFLSSTGEQKRSESMIFLNFLEDRYQRGIVLTPPRHAARELPRKTLDKEETPLDKMTRGIAYSGDQPKIEGPRCPIGGAK